MPSRGQGGVRPGAGGETTSLGAGVVLGNGIPGDFGRLGVLHKFGAIMEELFLDRPKWDVGMTCWHEFTYPSRMTDEERWDLLNKAPDKVRSWLPSWVWEFLE